MKDTWQLQRAKAELSKLIDTSASKGPQTVTRHGRAAAVVLSPPDYARLRRRHADFKRFLRRPGLQDLDLGRDGDRGRKIRL